MVNSRRLAQQDITVVELLVACSVICLLAGLLLPAIAHSRESARRADCMHRLGQVGAALHAYHDVHAVLPTGWTVDSTEHSAYGWFLQVLPYVDHAALFNSTDPRRSLIESANATAATTSVQLAVCPSDMADPMFALYQEIGIHEEGGQRSDIILGWFASANYVGVFGTPEPDSSSHPVGNGAFVEATPIRFGQLEHS